MIDFDPTRRMFSPSTLRPHLLCCRWFAAGWAQPMKQTLGTQLILLALAITASVASNASGEDYFVSTEGKATGDGSRDDPWLLTQVLTQPPGSIEPGDVVWIRGGVYRGPFVSNLSGTADDPITVRACEGEHVQLDLFNPDQREQAFFVLGDYVTYQGFEVTHSQPGPRTTEQGGPFQTDVNRGGVSVRGHHNKFVNLVVHDLNAGIGYWGNGGEIHGTIVYNNGWKAPDRQHGHGFYVQNDNGLKSVSDNIIFNQFGAGIHAFGTRASLNNLYFEGNVSFNNGAGVGEGFLPERDILVGGSTKVRNVTLRDNFTFQNGLDGVVDVGYLWGPENEDGRFTGNYVVGSFRFLQPFDDVVFTGNTIVSSRPIYLTTPQDRVTSDYEWDGNRYLSEAAVSFNLDNSPSDFADWRDTTGFDTTGEVEAVTTRPVVFVRPNQYVPGRANVIVYNWGKASVVEIDLSSVLQPGDHYEIVSAMDFYGEPLIDGVFDGQLIDLAMIDRPAPTPIGYADAAPVGTDERFGVFVVRKGQSGRHGGPTDGIIRRFRRWIRPQ